MVNHWEDTLRYDQLGLDRELPQTEASVLGKELEAVILNDSLSQTLCNKM